MSKLFTKKDFKLGMCRAILVSVDSRKREDFVEFTFKYHVANHQTGKIFEISETVVDNFNLVRCREFVSFLEISGVEFDTFDDLVGLTFDAWLERDFDGKNEFPVLTNKVILAHPFKKL